MRLVLGGYGDALGVVDLAGGSFGMPRRVAPADRPSWVVASPDGRFVYAALEREHGAVGAWAVGAGEAPWAALGERPTGGADPCHLALSPDGRHLLAANYSSGSVSVHPVSPDGSLGVATDLVQHSGQPGPVEDRQDGPHAHQVTFLDASTVLVCDLGLDAVIGYALSDAGRLTEVARSPFAPGTGPRHLALTPDGSTAIVLGELSSTLTVCSVDGAGLVLHSGTSTRGSRSGAGENTAAAVVVLAPGGDDTHTVLATNRGDDTLAAFALGRAPHLSLEATSIVGSGGRGPRFAGALPTGELVVTNESSSTVCVFAPDAHGWRQRDAITWPSPTCAAALN